MDETLFLVTTDSINEESKYESSDGCTEVNKDQDHPEDSGVSHVSELDEQEHDQDEESVDVNVETQLERALIFGTRPRRESLVTMQNCLQQG